MAYYDALRTQWALLSGTTAQKLAAVNALTANVAQPRGTLTVSQIIGAIAPADFSALTVLQLQQLQVYFSGFTGGSITTTGTDSVAQIGAIIFAGKTATLANLTAIFNASLTNAVPWWQANGYTSAINASDLVAAGGLT